MAIEQQLEELIRHKEDAVSGHCHWCFADAIVEYKGDFLCQVHYEAIRILEGIKRAPAGVRAGVKGS